MSNNDEYTWKYNIVTEEKDVESPMEDTIATLLRTLLKYVVLTKDNQVIKVDGFKYIKDIDTNSKSFKIFNNT